VANCDAAFCESERGGNGLGRHPVSVATVGLNGTLIPSALRHVIIM
jgi:hypothetical protein